VGVKHQVTYLLYLSVRLYLFVPAGVPEVNSLVSEATSAARVRRAAGDKYAEMLLVGDRTMQEHYKDKLKQYLLTVANVVGALRIAVVAVVAAVVVAMGRSSQ